jgi:basic amino acid/polyamine antiporter, APA family
LRAARAETVDQTTGLVRGLGLLDSVMMVAGSMIGSGIFIVSADVARKVGSAGWLVAVWAAVALLIVCAAASYGELAGMYPQVGGQYVFLREAYGPLWGFLFGWAMFLVIQTGTIAAVAVGFARYLGVLAPEVSPTAWIVPPLDLSDGYAVSLSVQQLVAILLIALLTWVNTRGLKVGKTIQNTFTVTKTLALIGLILIGLLLGKAGVAAGNFDAPWTPQGVAPVQPDTWSLVPVVSAAEGGIGLAIVFLVAMVGSLFSSGAWNDLSFAAGEVRNPERNVPRALVLGTALVGFLYVLANVAYVRLLPVSAIQNAPDDRVATVALEALWGPAGATVMALLILVSTFGCNNGLILAGARVSYAMARDGLFFRATGRLNAARVPAVALVLQGIWASFLVLPRTRLRDAAGALQLDPAGQPLYGNVYANLLNFVVFTILIFYVLAIAALFVLRRRRPDAPRPYRAFGYPLVPACYIFGASAVVIALLLYRTQTTWPGLLIVLSGIPVYFFWRRRGGSGART